MVLRRSLLRVNGDTTSIIIISAAGEPIPGVGEPLSGERVGSCPKRSLSEMRLICGEMAPLLEI